MIIHRKKCGYFFFPFIALSLIWIHGSSFGAKTITNMTVNVVDKSSNVQNESQKPGDGLRGTFEIQSGGKNGIVTILFHTVSARSVSNITGAVYSLSGQTVLKIAPSLLSGGLYKLDTSELLPGAYIVKISTSNSKSFTGNFLVLK